MSSPTSQHQAVCALVEEYPDLARELAGVGEVPVPEHGRPVAVPTSYPMPDGSTVQGDAVVQFRGQDGRARFFAQVEMQNEYSPGKLATLRAYHGGEVRRSRCGGHMFVLSPKAAETRRFWENDALFREEFAFRASYLSGADLAPLSAPGRSLPARALAAAMTDMEKDGVPAGARDLLLELQGDGKDRVADLVFKAMIEKCADISDLEVGMTDAAMDRLLTLPTFRARITRREAEVAAKAEAEGEARGEARARVEGLMDALLTYFAAKDDTPSTAGFAALRACDDPAILRSWLQRAYNGATSAQILENR